MSASINTSFLQSPVSLKPYFFHRSSCHIQPSYIQLFQSNVHQWKLTIVGLKVTATFSALGFFSIEKWSSYFRKPSCFSHLNSNLSRKDLQQGMTQGAARDASGTSFATLAKWAKWQSIPKVTIWTLVLKIRWPLTTCFNQISMFNSINSCLESWKANHLQPLVGIQKCVTCKGPSPDQQGQPKNL